MSADDQPQPQPPHQQPQHLTPLEKTFTTLLSRRRSRSLLRTLSPPPPPGTADFSSNDYLSLSTHPDIHAAFLSHLATTPRLGSTGSRLLDGNAHPLATTLEHTIATHHRSPAALLFTSGFDANAGLFASLPQPADAIVYDQLVHASVHDGMRLSRIPPSRRLPFAHCDPAALHTTLTSLARSNPAISSGTANVFIALESVYSMDGTVAPLRALLAAADAALPLRNTYLIVDEAHAVGLFGDRGAGLVCQLGLEHRIFARVVTFGKALGSSGAAVLCTPTTRAYLINYARPLIYTTALPHPSLASIHAVYAFLTAGRTAPLLTHLRTLTRHLHALLTPLAASHPTLLRLNPLCETPSPIVPVFTPRPRSLARWCQERGFMVRAIVAPTVERGMERVRVCLHAGNTVKEVEGLVGVVGGWVRDQEVRGEEGSGGDGAKELVVAEAKGSGVVEKARL